jgi:hypothetical protein
MDFLIYEIEEEITIWEGAALILNIDPADVIEQPVRLEDVPSYGIGGVLEDLDGINFYPDKEHYKYKKVMHALIKEANKEDSDFKAEPYYNEHNPLFAPEMEEICEASTINLTALKEWAISKGFKSEFLGNFEPVSDDTAEQSKAFNKQAKRELVFKCWLNFNGVDTNQSMTKTKQQIWDELQKLDKSLFYGDIGRDEFFKKQHYVNFPNGIDKKLKPLD